MEDPVVTICHLSSNNDTTKYLNRESTEILVHVCFL